MWVFRSFDNIFAKIQLHLSNKIRKCSFKKIKITTFSRKYLRHNFKTHFKPFGPSNGGQKGSDLRIYICRVQEGEGEWSCQPWRCHPWSNPDFLPSFCLLHKKVSVTVHGGNIGCRDGGCAERRTYFPFSSKHKKYRLCYSTEKQDVESLYKP